MSKLTEISAAELAGDLLKGAREIAVYLGLAERTVRNMLEHGAIPATKCGLLYIASKRRLRLHFQGETAIDAIMGAGQVDQAPASPAAARQPTRLVPIGPTYRQRQP